MRGLTGSLRIGDAVGRRPGYFCTALSVIRDEQYTTHPVSCSRTACPGRPSAGLASSRYASRVCPRPPPRHPLGREHRPGREARGEGEWARSDVATENGARPRSAKFASARCPCTARLVSYMYRVCVRGGRHPLPVIPRALRPRPDPSTLR